MITDEEVDYKTADALNKEIEKNTHRDAVMNINYRYGTFLTQLVDLQHQLNEYIWVCEGSNISKRYEKKVERTKKLLENVEKYLFVEIEEGG